MKEQNADRRVCLRKKKAMQNIISLIEQPTRKQNKTKTIKTSCLYACDSYPGPILHG